VRTLSFLLALLPLSVACSSVLGYDEVTFEGGRGAPLDASPGSGGSGGSGGSVGSGGSTASGGAGGSSGSSGSAGTSGASAGGSGGSAGDGGSAGSSTTGGSGGTSSGDPLESFRQACVTKINEYRATLGLPPYQRWTSAESCADGEAKSDSETGQAHGAFPSCGEWAQNECPGYPSLDSTVTTCLAQMWAEGPGTDFSKHGHYINMSSTSYSSVACGFFVTPSGSVWAVQDFQ
jgi:hypothetical protein